MGPELINTLFKARSYVQLRKVKDDLLNIGRYSASSEVADYLAHCRNIDKIFGVRGGRIG